MTPPDVFPPERRAALARLAEVSASDYALSRNALDGAVTRLSPYITHGLLSLPEVLADVAARHRLHPRHKLVFELGWREYFHHVWHHRGDGIFRSLHQGPLPERAYATELPQDIREGRTGVPAVDQSVRALYATGYLHNHARMWLASYVVHLRKVHWRAGADWMVAHLMDGDLGSNHLSWQWIAATASAQPYLFNADNVERFAPPEWHSRGSVLDTSYTELERWARSESAVPVSPMSASVDEPSLLPRPPVEFRDTDCEVAGRDVWLIHPWALGDPPADLPAGTLRLGWWPSEHHARWPWAERRWHFVGQRMAALADWMVAGDSSTVARWVASAQSVQTLSNLHVAHLLPPGVVQRTPPRLFPEVDRPCPSFSAWWKHVMQGVNSIEDLL